MAERFRFDEHAVTPSGVFLCAGCAPRGACRLGLTSMARPGDDQLILELACPPEHEGTGGVAHGAWIAGVMDEAVGALPQSLGVSCVTASLTVDYKAPVPLGRPLTVTARVESRDGPRWTVATELRLGRTGPVLARGLGRMVHPDPEHFARYRRWLARHDGPGAPREDPAR